MDQDGLFLMLKMCNGCSHNKGSWKKCMSRRHNPRMSTVSEDELTYSHRQCVKPDQAITIYKLHDHETNEDYLEFDEDIIFQTACRMCLNIKSCLREGHKLVDWRPTFAGGRVAGSSHPPPSPPASPPAPTPPPPPPPPTARGGGARRGGGGPGRAPRSARGRSASTSVVDDEVELVEDYGGGGGSGRKVFPAGGRGRRGHAAAAAAAGGAPQESTATPRGPHKRKSPASASSAYPRSASSYQGGKSAGPLKGKRGAAARRGRGGSSVSVGGRGRRRSAPEKLGDIPEMEIETDSSQVFERPHKRRGKAGTPANPAAVTLSPKAVRRDAFAASPAAAACEYDDEEEEEEGEGDEAMMMVSDGDAGLGFTSPPPVPKTVAERLELVKGEEAELLREFEETHKRIAQEEEAKREEMAEFQRAGEAALRAMQKEKEEALQRISAERKSKAAERQELLHKRFKEFETEEAEFRIEARERDARLEAEKEQLAKDSSVADAAVAAGGGDTPGGDRTGGDGPEWASDKWILAGMNGGGGGGGGDKLPVAEKSPVYVRDEKASAKAAAVARLLAGGVADASGTSGDGEPLDKEEGTEPASAEASSMSEKASGVSKGAEAQVDVAVPTAMVEDGDETPPPPAAESATTLGDGPAEASGDADGGGVVVPNDTDPEEEEEDPALAAVPAADDQCSGAKEPKGDSGANGGVVSPAAADADADAVAAVEPPSVAAL